LQGLHVRPERVAGLQAEIRQLRKQAQKASAADLGSVRRKLLEAAESINGHAVIIAEVPEAPVAQIRESIDWLRKQAGSAAVMLASRSEQKVVLIAGLTSDLVEQGISAGDWVAATAPAIDGRGGGKAQLAQAGGKNPEGIKRALQRAGEWIRSKL